MVTMELISRAKRFVAMIDFHKRQNPTNIGQIELYLDDNPNKFNMLIDVLQLEEYHDLQPIDLEYLRMCLVDETLIQKLISDQNKKVQICQIEIEKKIDIIRQYLVDQLTTYYVNKKKRVIWSGWWCRTRYIYLAGHIKNTCVLIDLIFGVLSIRAKNYAQAQNQNP